MPLAAILPPELWLIIFDLVIESGVDLLDDCDFLSFPGVLNRLRYPWTYLPKGIPALRNLRLVCRSWNELLKAPPCFVMKKPNTPVPGGVRAVYIYPCEESQSYLQRILAEPLKSRRIVILDLPGPETFRSRVPFIFDFLCENSHSLPSVRSLTLGLHVHPPSAPRTPRFWMRLNDAFPHLVALVLRGHLNTLVDNTSNPVVFRKLEISDHGMLYPDSSVHFPVLKHAAFDHMYVFQSTGFTGHPLLESLIFRCIFSEGPKVIWRLVPHLRLIALPSETVNSLASLPPEHPLQHLYIYVESIPSNQQHLSDNRRKRELTWLKAIVTRLPTISLITLAYEPRKEVTPGLIRGDFDEKELKRMGFTSSQRRLSGRGRAIVLRRPQDLVHSQPLIDTLVDTVSQITRFRSPNLRSRLSH